MDKYKQINESIKEVTRLLAHLVKLLESVSEATDYLIEKEQKKK